MTKYLIDDEAVDERQFWNQFEDAIQNEVEEHYDDWLDCSDEIDILGIRYPVSQVLKAVDPIRYRCGTDDYFNYLYEDYKYDLEHGEEVGIDNWAFKIEEVEDSDESDE